jgi:hypothetical protein
VLFGLETSIIPLAQTEIFIGTMLNAMKFLR